MEPENLRDFFLILKKLKEKNSKYLSRKFTTFNITYEQWIVLRTIKNYGTMSQTALGRLTHKSSPTLTRVLDHLEKKSMTERVLNQGDRRSYSVRITELGKQVYEQASTIENEFHSNIISDISTNDVKRVKLTFRKVLGNIENQICREQGSEQ